MYPCSISFTIKNEYMFSCHFRVDTKSAYTLVVGASTGISSQTGATCRGTRKAGANSESDFVSRAPPPNEANSLRPQQDKKVVVKEKPL
jgi:hypothetical protein